MAGKKKFNSDVEIQGKTIVYTVPNGTGTVITYNPTTKELSTRTNAELISDMSLMTTNTNQSVYATKYFNTEPGNNWYNNKLVVYSAGVADPSMSFYKEGVDSAQLKFNGSLFSFMNSDSNYFRPVLASQFIKAGSDADHLLLGDGGHDEKNKYIFGSNGSGTIEGYSPDLGLPSNSFKPSKSGFYRPNYDNDYGGLLMWVNHSYYINDGTYGAGIVFDYGGNNAWITGIDANGNKTPNRKIWTSSDFNPNDYWNKYFYSGYTGINTNDDFAILNNDQAQRLLTNGLLVSGNYSDRQFIPNQGIYSIGDIKTSGQFIGNIFSSLNLIGNQVFNAQNGDTLYMSNPLVSAVYVETNSGGVVYHNKGGNVKEFWSGHNSRPLNNGMDNDLKYIDASNYNDVVDGNGKIWLGNFYALSGSTTGFQSDIGTILNINGLVTHDKTQLIFNGGNGSIQYRTSWYPNTAWTPVRTLWDSNNLPNPATVSQLDNKVNKSGDTMTGGLTVSTPDSVGSNNLGSLPTNLKLYLSNGTAYGTVFWTEGSGQGYIQQQRADGNPTAYRLNLQPYGGQLFYGNNEVATVNQIPSLTGYATESWVSTYYIPKTHPVYNITQAWINSWNTAASLAHSHSNLAYLNNIDQFLGTGQAPRFNTVILTTNLYGQVVFGEDNVGGETGIVDLSNDRAYVARVNEYIKYGSSLYDFEAINVHFDSQNVCINREIGNDEDKVQLAGNISVDAFEINANSNQLILNPLYNKDGDVRFSRNAHIYIDTGDTVRLPQKPILGQRIEIYNFSDSDLAVTHDNVGTLFYIPAFSKITGIVGGRGFRFDKDAVPYKEYDI